MQVQHLSSAAGIDPSARGHSPLTPHGIASADSPASSSGLGLGYQAVPSVEHASSSSPDEILSESLSKTLTQEEEGQAAASSAPRTAPLPEDLVFSESAQEEDKQVAAFPALQAPPAIPLPHFVAQRAARRKDVTAVSLAEALKILKGKARAKFTETLEAHIRLSVDPRRSDQAVRVAVFAEGEAAQQAAAAGADVVGAEDLIARIKESGGKLDFDKCIATPSLMRSLGQVARILGPRGLMPNPKLGTVTTNVAEAVRAAKQGRVDFRADKTGIVHAGLGKLDFSDEALTDNVAAFASALLGAKPAGLKKSSRYSGYFTSFSLSSTMGPGVRVSIPSVANAADHYARKQV
eukprot:jgi/Mesen1/10112/ME000075S09615